MYAAASTAPAYKLLKTLGKGTFGTTYLAELTATAERVALKRIDALNSLERDAALAEYELMQRLQHALLVGARGLIVEPQELGQFRISIVMEYCDGGDLGQYVKLNQPLTEVDACRILKLVVAALEVLHSRGIVHRDLKPGNVLLCSNGVVKLGDFGLAKQAGSRTSKAVGTLAYMSLEAFAGRFQPHVDIWALGVMAAEMASAVSPTDLLRTAAQVADFVRTMPTTFSQNFSDAVHSCLEMDPGKRPTAAQLKDSAVAFIAPMISASFKDLHAAVDKAAWARPSQVPGLEWAVKSVGDGHSVKLADCSEKASPAQQRAVKELLELVSAAGSETLSFLKLQRVVLVRSRPRAGQLIAKMMDLNTKYANKALFSLEQPMMRGNAIDVDARRRTLQWFHDTYRSLMPEYPNVRTLLAFHATTSEEIAEQVCDALAMHLQRPAHPLILLPQVLLGNFAVLATLDAGYFGQGIYLTMDPDYAIEEYGRRVFRLTRVPLLICVVVVGNTLPVMPLRTPPDAIAPRSSDQFVRLRL
jgi:serine/threonine protein kinase